VTLQDDVVAAVAEHLGMAPDSEDFSRFLTTLRVSLGRLRKSFKAGVTVPSYWDPQVRLAYVLNYYVLYARAVPMVLESLVQLGWGQARHARRLLSFGTGPGSEIAGWMGYLSSVSGHLPPVTCVMNDKQNDGWDELRRTILRKVLGRSRYEQMPDIQSRQLDFCEPFDAVTLEMASKAGLITFQNCLNEVSMDLHDVFLSNLEALVRSMGQHCILVIVDLQKYDSIDVLFKKLRQRVSTMAGIERSADYRRTALINDGVPDVLEKHFFREDGGCFASRTYNFRLFACMKRREAGPVMADTLEVLKELTA